MIGVLDYGSGNIKAVINTLTRVNLLSRLIKTTDDLEGVSGLILPGVGSFDNAINKLRGADFFDPVNDLVMNERLPILGICVGLQILGDTSEEGSERGLGWLPGRTLSFDRLEISKLRSPHLGWNHVQLQPHTDLSAELEENRFFFLHSFFFSPDITQTEILGTTKYGSDFCVVAKRDNIFGAQFHPEKSHVWGEKFLANFARMAGLRNA
jgi:glutamine amidotransferase